MEPKRLRYFELVMAAYLTVLLCSNLIGVPKVTSVGGVTFGAGILFFPMSYLFGDVLTEVYGYARSRRVVWTGFAALGFASLMSYVVVSLPPAPGFGGQEALEAIFGQTPRIVLASFLAYFCGEFCNSYVLAKLKVKTEGRHLWMRTIGSTVAGEAVDSLIFYPIAFLGTWETDMVIQVMISNYCMKVLWEVLATPVTYSLVAKLKQAEQEDFYDRDTRFSPFSLKD